MENTAAYDIKLKELQVYLPFLENMRAKIHANSHDRLDEKARAEYLSNIHTLKSFLTDKGRRMKMDNLKKCETVLIKLSQKFERAPGADSPMTTDLQTTDSFDPLINAKQKKMSSESNCTIAAVSMNFYKELTENTETKEILNEINSLPITDTSDESANVVSSELEMCRVKLKSVFKMSDQKPNIEESLFTRRLVNPSSQQQPSPKVNDIITNLNSDSNLIPEKKLASERRPNYTRVLRSPNKNSPHSDRRSGSGSFSPVRRKSRDRYERHKRRSPEQKRSTYKPNRSPSSSKSRNYSVRQNDSRDSKRDKYYRESDNHKSRPRRRSSLSPRNKNDKINSKISEKKHDKTIRDKRENQSSVSKSDAIETYEIKKLNKLKSQLERELQENSNYDDLTDSSTPNSEPSDNADVIILIEKEDGEIGETDEEEDKNIDLLYGNLLDGIREDTIKDSNSDGKKTLNKKPDNTQQLKTSDNNVETTNISDLILKSLNNYNQSKSNASNNKVLTVKRSIDSDNIEDSNKKAKSPQNKIIVNPLDKPCAKKPTEEPKKIEVSSGSVSKVSPTEKKVSSSLEAINASTTFEQDILQALSKEIKETTPSVISFSKCTEIKPSIKKTEPLESAQQKSRRISLEKYKEKNNSSSFEISQSHGESVQSTDLSKKYEVYKKYVSSVLTPKERERFTSILDNTVEETIGDFDSIPKPRVNNLVPQFQSPVVNCDIINYVAPESPDSNSSFVYDMPSSPIEKPSIYEPPLTTNNQISTTKVAGKQCVQVMRTMGNNLPSWVAPNHKNYDGAHTISNTYSSMTSPNNTAITRFSNASGNKPEMVPSPSALTNSSSSILPPSLDVVGKVIESFTVPDVRQGNQIPQCSPRPSHFPNENINVRGDNTNFRFSSPTQFYQHKNQSDQSKSDSFPSAHMRPQNIPPLMSYPFHEDVDVNYASVKYGSEKPFPMLMNPMNPIYQHNSPTNAMNTHFNVGNIKPLMPNIIPVMINSNFPNRKMPTENIHVHSRDPRERNYGGNFHQESNLTRCVMDNRRQRLGNPELLMDMQFVQQFNKMPPERSFFQECSLNQISSFDELGRHQSHGRQSIPNMDSNSINRQITGQQIPPNAVYNRIDRGQSQGRPYNRELSMGRTVISDIGDQNHGRSYNREPSMGRVSILDADSGRMSRGRSQGRPFNRESSVGRTDNSNFSSDRMNRGKSQGRSYNREPSVGRMSISDVTSDRTGRGKSQGRSFNREPSMGRLDMNIIQSDRRNRDRSVGRSLNRDRETSSDIRSRRQSQGRSPNRDSSSKRSFTSDSTPSKREPSVGRFHSSSTDKNIGDNISYSSKRNSSSSRSNQDKDTRSETPRRQTESQSSSKTNPKDPRNRKDDSQRNSTDNNKKKAVDSKNPTKKTADKQRDFSSKSEQQNKRAENVKSKNECNDRLKYGPLHNAKPTDKNTLTTRSFSSSRSSADSQGIKFKIPKIKKVPAEVIKTINKPVVIPDQVRGFSKLCSEEPQASANDANRAEEMNLTETKICITESLISNVVDENCATIDKKSAPEIEDSVPKLCCKDESKTNSNGPNKEKATENCTQLVTDADEENCIDSTALIIGMKTDTISEKPSKHIEAESLNNLVSSTKSSEIIIHDNVELNEAPTSSDTKVDDMKSLNDEVASSIANILKDRSTMLEMLAFLKSKSGNETEKIEKIFERIKELNKDEFNPVTENEQETDKSPDIDKNSSVDKPGNNSTDTDIEGTLSVKESSSQDDEKEDAEHVVSSSSQKTAKTSKKYSKGNRELMMLQEDLREMFISQGVMDAENLGFRMCRLTSETKLQPEVVRRRKRSSILEKTESLKPSKPIVKRKKPSPKKSTKPSKVISNINDTKFPQVYIEELNSADKALSISNVDAKTSNMKIYDYDESNEDVELFAKSNSTKISNHNNHSITPIKSKINPIKSLKRVKLCVKVVKKSERKRPRKIFTGKGKRKTKKFLRQPLIDRKSNTSIDKKGSGDDQSTNNQLAIINNELDTVSNDELDTVVDDEQGIVVDDEQDIVFDNDQDIIATNVRKAAVKKITTPISKKKKRGNWSMGVIKRKTCVKDSKKLPISSIETDKPENDFVEPFDETTYHFLSGSLKYSCTLCKTFHGADIVGHFKNFHPHSEVLISRLHPGFARLAIHESHQKQPTNIEAKNDYDYKFQCRFCERLFVNVTPKTFFSHVVRSHTGEYRAKCNLCSKNGSMKMIHACNKFSDLPSALTTTEVFGYICGLCYYTQVSEENLKKHVSSRHTNTECEIIKINLSNNIFDSSDTPKTPEPITNKMLTRSKILKPESPLNDTATTPEKRKRISTPTEIPNKKPASDIVTSIQPQPVVVLEKSCPSENKLKTSSDDLSESAPFSLDESEVNVKLTQTLKIKQEVIDSTNQKTIQETNVAKKNLIMKEEPPSQTDVKVDSHITTNGKAVDMGVLQITQYKNGSATYDCRIRACAFHTNFFLIFVRHVKSVHSHDEWDGFCKVCSFQTIKEQYSSYVDALDHLMAHINVDGSDNVLATVKSEVVPTVAVPTVAVPTVAIVDVTAVQPKIQVRPLSDLMAKKPEILKDTLEQLDTPKDFAVSELCIESVVSLCPKNNIERCQDDKTSKLLKSKYTPNIMKKPGTVVISKQTTGQPVRLKPDALIPSSNENLDTATGNSQSSEEDFEKNELFECGAIDCVYSTNDPKTFIDHIENHFDISPNFECKCIDCSFTSSTGFDLVLHIERAHNKQATATKSPTFNTNPSGDNEPAETSTATQVLDDLQEAEKGNIDGILPKNSVFSRYSCTAAADTGGKCGATFLTPQLFLEHIKKDHRVRRIKCHECDSRALIFWTLIYHLRLCHSYCLYACVYCGANFDIEISAQRHLICEHADKRQLVYMRHVDVATEPLKKATEQIILLDIDPKSIARSIAVKKLSEGRSASNMAAVLNSIPAQTRRIPKLFSIVKSNSIDTAQSRDASPVALSKAPLSPAVHEQSIDPVIKKSASLESKKIDKLPAIQKSVKSNKESIAVPPVKDDNNSLVINLDSDEDDNVPLALTQIKIASKKNVTKESQKNVDASKADNASSKSIDDKESPVECIELLSDDESTPQTLNENSIQTSSPVNKTNESKPQRKKSITEDTLSLNSGLIGRDLYRCGNNRCSFSSITSSEFKDHLTICDFAKEHSKLPCYHCKRKFKSNMSLLDHIHNHGLLRYKCSVCNVVMRSALALNSHMNRQHKVSATTVVPCDPFKTNVDTDEFIVKPVTAEKNTRSKKGKVQPKPPQPAALSSPITSKKLTFDPDDINDLPLTPVFSDEVHCKKCTYATKVRSNMIRHLFLHSNEISVPSAAPVNPVPSSGPKHFDTMSNLALSSNLDKAPAVRISTERQERIKSGTNVKKLENIPAYIPKKERFVCGAKSCSYISVDEMMLRCHWEALHHEETVFKCAHCAQQIWAETGRRLTTGDIGDHLMLHKATLYQCNSCNFLHPQVKGIERHIIESACNGGVPKLLRERRAWQCEICSTRTVLKSEIVQHCKQAHNALNQFKCSLCLHYNSSKDCFFDHFKKNHSGRTVDVVSMYSKGEDPFDVSPLWWKQRKRGSGFVEEVQDMPAPKKTKIDPSPACEKTAEEVETAPESIHYIINNLHEMDTELDIKPDLQILSTTPIPPQTSTTDHTTGDIQLLELMPQTRLLIELPNKLFQCAMCSEYTSKFQSDMKIHLYEELNYRKWSCEVCNYRSFDEASIINHCMQAHRIKKIKELSPHKKIEDWVEKNLAIMNNATDTSQETVQDSADSDAGKLISSKTTSETITTLHEKLYAMNNASVDAAPSSSGVDQLNDSHDNLFTVLYDPEKVELPAAEVSDSHLETGNKAVHTPVKRGQKQKLFSCGHCNFATSSKTYVRRHHRNKHSSLEYKLITLGEAVAAVSAPPPAVPSPAVVSRQEKNFMCLVCETSVANLDIVQHHQSCHPNETNQVLEKKIVVYKCQLCMQLTACLPTMMEHFEKLHPDVEKNYVMHKLGSPKFKRIMAPRENRGAESNTKYYCRYCPRVLSDFPSLLEHHQLCHSDDLIGIMPGNNSPIDLTGEINTCESILSDLYDCKISGCDYTSESTQDYLFHTRSHYVSYKCDICSVYFIKYSGYVKHKSEHANAQVKPKFTFVNNFVVRQRLRQIIDMLGKTFPSIGNIQLDHFLQTDIDDVDASQNQIYSVPTTATRLHQVARKSTTQIDVNPFPRLVIAEEEERDSQPILGYSNYGKKPDTDFKGITAKIPIMGRSMPFTIDKLSELFQLFPNVLVEDCRRGET